MICVTSPSPTIPQEIVDPSTSDELFFCFDDNDDVIIAESLLVLLLLLLMLLLEENMIPLLPLPIMSSRLPSGSEKAQDGVNPLNRRDFVAVNIAMI